jgi:hypothetical protein
MAVSTIVEKMNVPTPAGAAGPRIIPVRADGLPLRGLTNSFKFLESTYTGGVQDDITGNMHALTGLTIDANNSQTPASGGGGLVIKGWREVQGPKIDVSKPFTVVLGMTLAPMASASLNQSFLAIGDSVTTGMWHFLASTASDPFTAGNVYGMYAQYFDAGVVKVVPETQKPWVAQFGSYFTWTIKHDGNGKFSYSMIKDGRLQNTGFTIVPPSKLVNGATVNELIARIGGIHTAARSGTITFEGAFIYNVELDKSEITVADLAVKALAVSRGRS